MSNSPRTAVLLLNMGGPSTPAEIEPFLTALFTDRALMKLPFQSHLGPFIARRRAPKVAKRYELVEPTRKASPLRAHTEAQAAALAERLDVLSPETAPHLCLPAFRYSEPRTPAVIARLEAIPSLRRIIAFSQYPHFSCLTTGSSMREVREAHRFSQAAQTVETPETKQSSIQWTEIDRWPARSPLSRWTAGAIKESVSSLPPESQEGAIILFSTHSLPLRVIERGDPYLQEVSAMAHEVMKELGHSHRYLLTWQSAVGPVRWLGPPTSKIIKQLGDRGAQAIICVPFGFVTDHLETLYDLDYVCAEIAADAGVLHYRRVAAPNAAPSFIEDLAGFLCKHLADPTPHSQQHLWRCPGCPNDDSCPRTK